MRPESLPRKRRDAGVRSAGIQPFVPEKPANWPAGTPGTRAPTAPPAFPLGGVRVAVLTGRVLFPVIARRGRAPPYRNQSEGGADRGTQWDPASLGRAPTTCQVLPCLTSLKAQNINPLHRRTPGWMN